MKFRLISGSYHSVEPESDPSLKEAKIVIELYGRDDKGRSITVLYHRFRPYFYVVDLTEDERGALEKDPEVVEMEEVELEVKGVKRRATKVYLQHPFKVPQYRDRLQDGEGFRVLAADIPYIFRFLYDLDLGSTIEAEGVVLGGKAVDGSPAGDGVARFNTDIVLYADSLKDAHPFELPLKVLSFDIENFLKRRFIATVGWSVAELPLGGVEGIRKGSIEDDDQRALLKKFRDFIIEEDPDVITGYNIDGYDLEYLYDSVKEFFTSKDERDHVLGWSRDFSPLSKRGYRNWKLHGRVIADAWWNMKRELKPKVETLNYVSQMLFGEGKEEVDPLKIEELWEKERERVISYCIKDSELALRILDYTDVLRKYTDIANVAKLPLEDALNGTTSVLIDSILIREADRRGIGVPCTRHSGGGGRITGGYVHSIEPGLYRWVVVMDFKSMYPSIIIAHNICFTTLVEEGGIPAPNGAQFLPPEVKRGLLPDILSRLMKDREEAKRRAEEAKDEEERRYYSGLQIAIKILMNSFYGVFASSFYRFTDKRIGEAITSYARQYIKDIISALESEGHQVIYSDTDSIFVKSPYEDLEGSIRFGEELARRFSKGATQLEFEKVLDRLYSHGKKKRYVGRAVWPEEDIIIRGYETRRTDTFDLLSELQMQLFERILEGDTEGAVRIARETIERTRRGEVPTEKLVISRTVKAVEESKIRSAYVNPDSMANVQAARKLRDRGYELVPGMKVSWVVVNASRTPQVVEPFVDSESFSAKPDYDYYAERLISTTLRILEPLGIGKSELLKGTKQSRLFSFGTAERRRGREGGPKDSSTLTLDRFL